MRAYSEPTLVPCESELDDALTDRLLLAFVICACLFYVDIMVLALSFHKHWVGIRQITLAVGVALGIVLTLAIVWISCELRKESGEIAEDLLEDTTRPHPPG